MLATLKSDIRGSIGLFSVIVIANILVWDWALISFGQSPTLFAMASMSWMLGLRHALSPIHIAVIDNATRKLMQNRTSIPVNVGTYFSLGHSTMIIAMTISVSLLLRQYPAITQTALHLGHCFGHLICGIFLLVVASLNGIALKKTWVQYQAVKYGITAPSRRNTPLLAFYAFFDRHLKTSKQMYLLGFLFGMCAMTTSELSVMSIATTTANTGISWSSMVLLSVLFTMGMLLVDSINNIVIGNAYRWTLDNPFLKLYYNTALTGASMLMAVYVGLLCITHVVTQYWPLSQPLAADLAHINHVTQHFGFLMIVIILVFWAMAFCHYRWRGYHLAAHTPQ
ncbi:HoxN/HupN/NixA family nickel/cobalt transporter [Vibrio palustris]|uniref:Nickel/cobalt efflux system n=1 Tax=Vibrio palustris TaxID=1918946 RepID=A0A1R4B2A6_9VIBR|nr:hypothetical protein [Vibrio palustris]SJL83047.1 High-affinity nickel transport protein [Vibrio palustris]